MIKNLFILDYNDTIVLGIEKVADYFITDFFGKEIFNQIQNSNFDANNDFEKYKQDNSFTLSYDEAKNCWQNFKNGVCYLLLNNTNAESIKNQFQEFDKFFEKEQEIDYKKYCCDELICPLIAMYNIYITQVKPEETFKIFMEKYNSLDVINDNLLLINTGGPEIVVENEIKELIKLNSKKYNYLNYFLKNNLVFGSNASLSKADAGRIETIINILKNRGNIIDENTRIIIIGDAKSDSQNFEEFDDKYPNISKSIFIVEKRTNNYDDLILRAEKYKKYQTSNINNKKLENFYNNQEKATLKNIKKIQNRENWLKQVKKENVHIYHFVSDFSNINI